jgi:hypothetical protein
VRLALAQRADGAAVAVRTHDVELEALLVESIARLASGVRADIRPRDQAAGLHVLDRQSRLENDNARGGVVGGHEHRRDDEVLARLQRTEVDERGLQLECGSQRAVVGLIDGTAAVCVGKRAPP